MTMRRLLCLLLCVGLSLVSVALSEAAPISSTRVAFYDGNAFVSWTALDQARYLAGALDMMTVLAMESLHHFYSETSPVPLLVSDSNWATLDAEMKADIARSWALATMIQTLQNIPEGATLGQLHSVVKKHLDENPQSTHNSAALLIWRALAETDWE